MVHAQQVSPNPIDVEADLYEYTMVHMDAHGYAHYEVSNYALPGFRSRHNSNYWNHENYLGFGPSAHSFWKEQGRATGRRWWNIASVSEYCSHLGRGDPPRVSEETVSSKELITERIFLGLRSDGVDLRKLHNDFGVTLHYHQKAIIRDLVAQEFATLENDVLRLTSHGFLLCDEVAERLIA
jgi:oxygen-independent coproporphyrinogen-3 oxidase